MQSLRSGSRQIQLVFAGQAGISESSESSQCPYRCQIGIAAHRHIDWLVAFSGSTPYCAFRPVSRHHPRNTTFRPQIMPRDESRRVEDSNPIDAQLEALDEKGRAILNMLNRSTVIQTQHQAQHKGIESRRSRPEKQKQVVELEKAAARRDAEKSEREKREKESRERGQKKAKEGERQMQKEGERRDSGMPLPVGSASVRGPEPSCDTEWEVTDTWEPVPEDYSCPRCAQMDIDCYRLVTSFGGKARAGSASETPNRVRFFKKPSSCKACRQAKSKCQPPPDESPASLWTLASQSSAAPMETLVQRTRKRPIDKAEQDSAPISEGKKRQRLDPKIQADCSTLNKLEALFTDLVKHQETVLSIQRQILQTISSSRPRVLDSYKKEEETDELEYTDGE